MLNYPLKYSNSCNVLKKVVKVTISCYWYLTFLCVLLLHALYFIRYWMHNRKVKAQPRSFFCRDPNEICFFSFTVPIFTETYGTFPVSVKINGKAIGRVNTTEQAQSRWWMMWILEIPWSQKCGRHFLSAGYACQYLQKLIWIVDGRFWDNFCTRGYRRQARYL